MFIKYFVQIVLQRHCRFDLNVRFDSNVPFYNIQFHILILRKYLSVVIEDAECGVSSKPQGKDFIIKERSAIKITNK